MQKHQLIYKCPACGHINSKYAPPLGDGVVISASVFWCGNCQARLSISYRFENGQPRVTGEVQIPSPFVGPYHRKGLPDSRKK